MDPVCGSVWPKVAVLLLLAAMRPRTEAMTITSTGSQTIQQAEGDSVNLGCTYTPAAEDKGELDIEWSNVSPDMTQKDKLLLSYAAGATHNYYPEFTNRMKFLTEPNQGDASITISGLKVSDTGTYQCKVKKAPGVDMRKVTLVVLVPPSTPRCWVEGGEEKGATVSLRCKSSKGSTPLTYVWTRETGGAMPATATQDKGGELLIKNHTDSNTGTYVCEVKNAVGQAQCRYDLRAYNPTNKVGVIVGAVIGALLLLILLLILIWLLIICCQKKRYQKEAANEIREDAPAPESRPSSRQSSRHSSFQSMAGYRTHQGVQYTSVRGHLPNIHESGPIYNGGSNSPSIAGDRATSLKYDQRYGYAV
ncbi:V-set and immunoglobulin domain-containing protein 8b [Xiphophorus hellerii]|uniref:V-set and immunoglobulin domain-containing protein 8b n=1 Tax=Xiphophorus hellerii TaxID=8084 RepID=UPI0013B396BD|nr:coxsackievirus and adenovirus receptor homolog [Xiphophorus hellerii]XP_032435056.1 coxsackievirus and adenovirus receptor homolog [Xiphophorus hellerii]